MGDGMDGGDAATQTQELNLSDEQAMGCNAGAIPAFCKWCGKWGTNNQSGGCTFYQNPA